MSEKFFKMSKKEKRHWVFTFIIELIVGIIGILLHFYLEKTFGYTLNIG